MFVQQIDKDNDPHHSTCEGARRMPEDFFFFFGGGGVAACVYVCPSVHAHLLPQ